MTILTSATTWEAAGFLCALVLLFNHRICLWISQWVNKGSVAIREEIQAAAKLEEDAKQLVRQYRDQMGAQQAELATLKKQNARELAEIEANMAKKTNSALQRQREATDIHIRLVATQHQKKVVTGILDKFIRNTTQHFKKQKNEDMNASITHLFNALEQNPEIFKQL